MELALAAGTFLAAIAATYFFCVRPMRQGRHCAMSPPTDTHVTAGHIATGVTPEDLQTARAELEALRAAMADGDSGAKVEVASTTAPRHVGDTGSRPNGPLDGAA